MPFVLGIGVWHSIYFKLIIFLFELIESLLRMYSFLIFIAVQFLPFTTAVKPAPTCSSNDGTNVTCQAACLRQPCDTRWTCNGTLLSICEQSCYDKSCSRLTCDELAQKCKQYCKECKNMKCNSAECHQSCTAGYCHDMTCNAHLLCDQICKHCRRQLCFDSEHCTQTCLDSNCSLECLQSQVCQQHCYGDGCLASCHGKKDCFQTCYPKGNCSHFICESGFCSQKCANTSRCGLLRCHGEYCEQETYVLHSKLECSSSLCHGQLSHVSNTFLTCDNVNGSCVQKCFGSGCVMSCGKDVKVCKQYCYGGNCSMTCARGSEKCTMECPGGKCRFSCGAKQCLLSCENEDCERKVEENNGDKTDQEDNREKCCGCKLLFHPLLLIFVWFSLSLA